jgi:hypothetical protein
LNKPSSKHNQRIDVNARKKRKKRKKHKKNRSKGTPEKYLPRDFFCLNKHDQAMFFYKRKTPLALETQIKYKNINNFSKRILTCKEIDILALGGKFAPSARIDVHQMINEFSSFTRLLKLDTFFTMNPRIINKSYNPRFKVTSKWEPNTLPQNVTKYLISRQKEFEYLINTHIFKKINKNLTFNQQKTLKNLMNDDTIKICNSDKNMGLAIVDSNWYEQEVYTHLNNSDCYIKRIPNVIKIRNSIIELIESYKNQATQQEYKFLLKNCKTFISPQFYLLLKIHKSPMSSRPIVPSHRWITAGASIWLDHYLNDIMIYCTNVIKDSKDLINIIENTSIKQNAYLITGDITSLYTNIDTNKGIRITSTFIRKYIKDTQTQNLMIKMLEFVLYNNYFIYNMEWYHQISGTAMGTQMAPKYANIYLQFHENILFNKREKEQQKLPKLYKRYLDDILIIWEDDLESLQDFLNSLNLMNAKIKISWNIDTYSTEFLDLNIYKGNRMKTKSILDLRVHQKQLNPYMYIPFKSAHSLNAKKAFIKTEIIRYIRASSDIRNFNDIISLFYTRLRDRGYPPRLLTTIFNEYKVLYCKRNDYLQQTKGSHTSKDSQPPWIYKTRLTPIHKVINLRGFLTLTLSNYADMLRVITKQTIGHTHAVYNRRLIMSHLRTPNLYVLLNRKLPKSSS